MEDEYNIKINNEEGYSPEAIANFERSVEEFSETLLEIKPEHANISVFRSLKMTVNGRPRRIGEFGNVDYPDDPLKIELMIGKKVNPLINRSSLLPSSTVSLNYFCVFMILLS